MTNRLEKVTKELLAIPKFGTGLGLHRMQYLCQEMTGSAWAQSIDPINVVGSNGKGSTASIIAAIMHELGIRAGKYTSPHLFNFTERIVINGREVSAEALEKNTHRFFEKQGQYLQEYPEDQIGAFEAFTFIALSCFFEEKVDAIVLEAGIGGRYDSTRIMTGNYTALVSIDLEHTNLLGPTREIIAFEKTDIAPEGSTVVVGKLEKDLLRRLKAYARYKKVQLIPVEEVTEVTTPSFENGKMALDFRVEDYTFDKIVSNLAGFHQVNNILVSVLLLKHWIARNFPAIGAQQFISATRIALENIVWTGRLEKIKEHPPTYIDVGHTPDAIKEIVHSFKGIKKEPCLLVLGVSYDKEVAFIIKGLLEIADVVVCTRAYHKGAPVAEVYNTVTGAVSGEKEVFQYEKIEDAIDFSLDYASKHGMCILVAGGLFLSAEACYYLKGKSPSDLNFF